MRGKKSNRNFKNLRLHALQDRIEQMPISRRELARRIKRSQGAIQAWFDEDRWPEREDDRLEKACRLPLGFFAHIEQGMSYDEALKSPSLEKRKGDIPLTLEQREKLASHFATIDKNWKELAEMLGTLGVTVKVGMVGESKKSE